MTWKQNRILAFLSQNTGKSPDDQEDDEMLTQITIWATTKKAEVLDDLCESDESVEPYYDDQTDVMINSTKTKKNQT